MRAELERWAEDVLGPCLVENDASGWHGKSCVLRIRDAGGVRWFAKRHRYESDYAREIGAYRAWVPMLGDRAPRLFGCDDGSRSLLLSCVPGAAFGGVDVEVHRDAGRLLRLFHDADSWPPDPSYAVAKQERLECWLGQSDGLLAPEEVAFARAELRTLEGIPAFGMVPCHFDYSPRNWLVERNQVHVIDFELAAPDVWVNDLGRLYFGPWRGRSDLREAFLDGYGRTMSDDEHALLLRTYAGTVVWLIIWAHRFGNRDFEAALREILHALMRREFG